jgi:two-component system, OmpR family, response regulator
LTHRILIVDDDLHIREVIRVALKKAGMTVAEARDGREALTRFGSDRPDLIILDVGMPEFDGLEVCREIRKTSDVPILFLSARDDEIDRVLGLEIGGDDYVTKPFSPRELVARVNVILRRMTARGADAKAPSGQLRKEASRSIRNSTSRLLPVRRSA